MIDYRIYDKQGDGKTKLDHVAEMLKVFVEVRKVAFSTVLMDSTMGKVVKLNKFPKHHKVKVFRVASTRRTDYVVTNDLSQSDVSATQQASRSRWKIEHFHREAKQLTGLGTGPMSSVAYCPQSYQ